MLNRIELIVKDVYNEVVYKGTYEGFLELNDYEDVLLECISKLSSRKYNNVYYTNDNGEDFILSNTNEYEDDEE